ncbi:MAG: leucine-rich repeat domain-containing protein, partial [Oscillospiraceae bacterium]|nr:leucine-rich repeat domain-containing protein [Oscillospiraceae bacterium]
MKQRLLSLLLALALLLSLLPAAAPEIRAADPDEPFSPEALEIQLGETVNVVIQEPDEPVWLCFSPRETGWYVLSAAAEFGDSYCTLYDSELSELFSDDDSGDGTNFRLSYRMEAGERYYFEIRYLEWDMTGSFPVTLTVYDPVRSGECGDELSWSFDLDTGILTIEGQGDMWSFWPQRGDGYVSSDAVPWHEFQRQITGLQLPEGLSSIGDVAFQSCLALDSVTIPGTVRRIGQFAFSGCGALQSIVIPEGVTTIGARAFDFCESLTEVELSATVSSVEELAFRECYNLETIRFLNPACDIADDCLADARSVIVCGFPESTAERFAAEHGLLFLPVGATELTGVCGDELSWRFDLETNVLTVEGEGAMWDMWDSADFRGDGYYSGNAQPWKAISHRVTGLLLPEGLS